MKMDEGVELMNQGNFEKAEELFREVLLNVEVVPADLCFYFGKNSFHLDKFSQSIDWLNKYIELKGTSGRFFDAAVEYLKLAEEEQQFQSTASQIQNNKEPRKREFINCEQTPFVVCPVCSGQGVSIERGSLGTSIYKACQYCKETGRMSCENYKLFLVGKFDPVLKNDH
ncbi:tetratricopeptide (TPR) repeat protein [Catalinimonas alkaloidigena]|uniref:tetratricopeptide repeat protein n=1 Tax=Catalinimonas alkaloidigena TaxID=1075417 RepID=UPI002406B50C|nr:hypothetical protein [Catalinimonas alkaloidigena]MDF9797686.1 tetratricopeptide (TPR) repeat protein [Catalinimonas alkaloidigena]